ncbi:MAG: exo-beta-N-acetylmuramidase NamZ family protein [Aggregatilineales bacterium]
MSVKTGIDVLHEHNYAALAGKRIGLLANAASVDKHLVSTYERLWQADTVNLVALFGAEHGFSGAIADGETVNTMRDPRTNLPIYSLYGMTVKPSPDMLADIDAIVVDIQDVGVRYYTFVWTVSYLLEAAGEAGIEIIILDRPNPLAETVDGLPLEADFSSFVGRYDVPVQHGMTIGELAQMMNTVWNETPAALTVVACKGYRCEMTWQETGLLFVPPSPNMPHLITAQHYPGACLLEGTTLSEGRGTSMPFEVTGAPYIDGWSLADNLNTLDLPGVRFRAHSFVPSASKYTGEQCAGVQAHIMDGARYRPFETWLHVIQEIRHHYPDDFAWLPPYKEGALQHFDRLVGSDRVRQQIEDEVSVSEILIGCDSYCATFRERREQFLLYS